MFIRRKEGKALNVFTIDGQDRQVRRNASNASYYYERPSGAAEVHQRAYNVNVPVLPMGRNADR